jgi:sulfonate transport system substrate-binding protein
MTKPSLFLAGFILLASVLSRAEDQPKVIHFGEISAPGNIGQVGGKPSGTGLVPLAIEKGFFEEEFGKDGPKIEVSYYTGTGPAINEALAQGDVDFGSYGGLPNVIGLSGGVPAHIVAARRYALSYYIGVKPDSAIKTVQDLKGKRISVQKGTNPYQSLVLFLESRGLTEKDVNIVNLGNAEALVAFNSGAIDAIFGSTALLLQRDKGQLRVLVSTKGFQHAGNTSGTLVSDKFEKAYPSTVARVVKVLTKTAWWASEEKNREDLLQFLSARAYGYNYTKEEYAGPLSVRFNPLIDNSVIGAFSETVKFAAQHKMIRKEVPETTVRSWFLSQYQAEALKQLKLEDYWTRGAATSGVALVDLGRAPRESTFQKVLLK